ncbi:MAG: MBL fold metallo-hydrolase [Dongiaceae bacterium]
MSPRPAAPQADATGGDREPLRVHFLGTGDAFGSGGRFNTCFLVRDRRGGFLIDCGASSMIAMRKFGVDPNGIRAVLISHLHGDHFGGLPYLLLDAQLVSRRTAPLAIAGPPGLAERLAAAMENAFPGSGTVERRFPLEVIELAPQATREVAGVAVTPHQVRHPCGAPPFALRLEVDGRIIAYSGDTEWVEALGEAARGADLFIAEAYFPDRKVKYHLDFATLAQHLPEIGARRVILTHMTPAMLAAAAATGCEAAEDGMVVAL